MSKYIKSNLLKLIIVLVLVVVFWLFAMTMVDKPSQDECLYITFVGKNFDNTSLETFFEEYISNNTNQELRELSVNAITDPDDYSSGIALTVRAIGEADFIVYEEEYCKDIDYNFLPLTNELLEEFSSYDTFDVDGVPYGIAIPTNDNFSKFYKGESKCYAFITKVSENMAGLNGNGETENDAALIALKYLLGE